MYYVNVSFTWILAVLSIAGYFYTLKNKSQGWAFWPLSAAAWALFGTSHAMLIGGVSTDEWYMTVLRILAYLLMICALLMLMVKVKRK